MSKASEQASRRADARESLEATLTKGQDITCIVTSVSRSGMSRRIRLLVASGGRVVDITWRVGIVLGWSVDPDKGLRVDGAGMDMCFHTVYTLAHVLYGDGYALNAR